ncbi:MAG: hypothetical protein LBM70_08735 [Victivallales bacterium]|jgi:hypothetical protein|nr:hypothetical protein [Victivallales bacterium]
MNQVQNKLPLIQEIKTDVSRSVSTIALFKEHFQRTKRREVPMQSDKGIVGTLYHNSIKMSSAKIKNL